MVSWKRDILVDVAFVWLHSLGSCTPATSLATVSTFMYNDPDLSWRTRRRDADVSSPFPTGDELLRTCRSQRAKNRVGVDHNERC